MTDYSARRSSGKGGRIQGRPRARKPWLGGTLHRLQSQSFFGAANHASADNAAGHARSDSHAIQRRTMFVSS